MRLLITASLWFLVCGWSLAVPDGGWNGKPWEKEKLALGAKNFHADAMAEWAYCSAESVAGIEFNKQQIYRRARASAEKGSALGKCMLAVCAFQGWGSEIKEDLGRELLKEALVTPHPEAIRLMGVYQVVGSNGIVKNPDEGLLKVKQAAEAGSLHGRLYLGIYLHHGTVGELDLEGAAEIYQDLLMNYESRRAAQYVYRYFKFNSLSHREMRKFFKEEHFEKAEKLLHNGIRLKFPYAEYLPIYHDVYNGKLHQSMPVFIENSQKGPWYDRSLLYIAARKGDSDSGIVAITMGGYTEAKAAEIAWRTGLQEDKKVAHAHANALLYRSHKFDVKRQNQGREILKGILLREGPSECNASHDLAGCLCRSYFLHKREKRPITEQVLKDYERGMHHYILHSGCSKASKWIVDLNLRKDEISDRSKALATTYWLEKIAWGHQKEWNENTQKKLLKELTEEQLKKAQELREDEFPHGERWRREAFEALQKIGDIGPSYEFDPGEKFPDAEGGF